MRFDGKVAVITGGGGGLGRGFADALGAQGARVALIDIEGDAALGAASELGAAGVDALGLACDITDEAEVERALAAVNDRFGRIDILVNNAALHRRHYNQPFSVLPRSDLRALLEVNIVGTVNCSVAARPFLAASGNGAIVNISSTASNQSRTPYGISKLAVNGLTVALAAEFGVDDIRVNGISPGFVATAGGLQGYPRERLMSLLRSQGALPPPESIDRFTDDELGAMFLNLQSLGREGCADDVVQTLLYLCSDAASFVSGETIRVAGGSANGF